jgi:lipopolysaccharide transport system ATP-binding protein
MEDVSSSGRTILFVSHNMSAVKKLCKRGILLQQGKLMFDGTIQDAVDKYSQHYDVQQTEFLIPVKQTTDMPGYAHSVFIEDLDGKPCNEFGVGMGWQVRIKFKILNRTPGFIIGLGMLTPEDVGLRTSWSEAVDLAPGDYEAVFKEDQLYLGAGYYKLVVGLSSRMMAFQYVENCAYLRISEDVHAQEHVIKYTSGVGIVLNPMSIQILSCKGS